MSSQAWNVARIVEATGGTLIQGDPSGQVRSIATDSRKVGPGDCFLALRGERHDAHDFVSQTLAAGARSVVVSEVRAAWGMKESGISAAIIQVEETLHALGELARFHRRRFDIPVVGIGGSNGKTSTKEMVASILSRTRRVLKNPGNLNNLVGAPLTLLELTEDHQAAVIEMGINVPGEMARLSAIVGPTVGLLTNIHPAHLEGLGSLDDVLAEKGKLLQSLGPDGVAVVNWDDPRLRGLAKRLGCRVIRFGTGGEPVEVRLMGRVSMEDGLSVFEMGLGSEGVAIRLPVLGMHQVQNALAAAAVAWALGDPPPVIAAGLESHRPVRQRMELHRLGRGRVLVDDTYNANPRSMISAVQTAREAAPGARLIVVLGDMRELGPESRALHREVGLRIGAMGIQRLVTLGDLSTEIDAGAREGGLAPSRCAHAGSHEEAVERVTDSLVDGAWVVVKGSRGMTMEKVVTGILESIAAQGAGGRD
ncbi:MAG: UDP-N-acetylmuramoyl-tripeptide--D-alanyl-D-alanine ligase [Syntrophobacteraceae bacterium]|jgi:UDP-N-acetylmuramoyl-tripeptide--D-alanyl-D-alanine ligase|nr:UDP-N-acetylmuramoyl-tripeptide--D-alanyl-D-alanine ligase [Syntrophobacteraceae bacterium]